MKQEFKLLIKKKILLIQDFCITFKIINENFDFKQQSSFLFFHEKKKSENTFCKFPIV